MELLKIKKHNGHYHVVYQESSIKLDKGHIGFLGEFLTEIDDPSDYKEWIYSDYWAMEDNDSCLEKRNDKIYISGTYAQEPKDYFEIAGKQLVDILDQWGELYQRQPQQIILTYENGKVELKGIFDSPETKH